MPRPKKPIAQNHSLKRAAFLQAYAQVGNITAAAKMAGCDPSTHRAIWMKQDDYLPLFEEAKEQAVERLEAEAIRRATQGPKPSDILLIFLLKAARPQKYRDHFGIDATVQMAPLLADPRQAKVVTESRRER